MAKIYEPSPEEETGYKEWLAERPPNVRAVAERFDPWSLYKFKSGSNNRVVVISFQEHKDGIVTLTVRVSAQYNAVMFERDVFGIRPDDLEPCDIPSTDEPHGALLTTEEVEENIDAIRVMGRPDLWEMGADGKAHKRSDVN